MRAQPSLFVVIATLIGSATAFSGQSATLSQIALL